MRDLFFLMGGRLVGSKFEEDFVKLTQIGQDVTQSVDKLVNHFVSMILKTAVLGRKRTFGSIP